MLLYIHTYKHTSLCWLQSIYHTYVEQPVCVYFQLQLTNKVESISPSGRQFVQSGYHQTLAYHYSLYHMQHPHVHYYTLHYYICLLIAPFRREIPSIFYRQLTHIPWAILVGCLQVCLHFFMVFMMWLYHIHLRNLFVFFIIPLYCFLSFAYLWRHFIVLLQKIFSLYFYSFLSLYEIFGRYFNVFFWYNPTYRV